MLKKKLISGLLVILAAILMVGSVGVWMLRDEDNSLNRVVSRDLEGIQLVNDFAIMAAKLEAQYLNRLVKEAKLDPLDDDTYESLEGMVEMRLGHLSLLSQHPSFEPDEREALEKLDTAARNYFDNFKQLFSGDITGLDREERLSIREKILSSRYEMVSRVSVVQNLLETSVANRYKLTHKKTITTSALLAAVCIGSIILAFAGYFFLIRRVIDPTEMLTESLRKVQQQDFDQVVSVKSLDEFGMLASSFNDMSAELRELQVQKDDEMARLDSERRAILDGFPTPVFILDNKGMLSQANPAAHRLLRAIGETGPIPKKVSEKLADCIKSNSDYLPEEIDKAILFRIEEIEYWFLPRIFRTKIEGEEIPQGWAIVFSDVSTVRFIDDMKSDLIGTVSHEVKTPLTSIRMVLHLLDEQKIGDLNNRQETMVKSALDDCERLLETLENLLQLTRLESGRSELKLEPVNIEELVNDAVDSMSGQASDANIEIEIETEDELPGLVIDRNRIHQVLSNLLSNAIKHSPANNIVTLRARTKEKDMMHFSVLDHGIGVPKDEVGKIFDRFYSAPEQQNGGAGLGLWISREIVRAHSGHIGVEKNTEDTTEFYFEIPISGSY